MNKFLSKIKSKQLPILLLLLLFSNITMFAQSKKQRSLEKQRQEIIAEIKEINSLLSSTKQEKRSLLGKIEDLNLKIEARQSLIRITNKQANLLKREITANQSEIKTLQKDLESRRKDYANVVVNSHKNKSQHRKMLFLLSSENFLQAYKRYNYMKQYKAFQKKIADSIVSKTTKLESINNELLVQKKDKDKLVAENKKAKEVLLNQKEEQKTFLNTIKKDTKKYERSIAKKQKENNAINRKIEKLIQESIARANKKNKSKPGKQGTIAMTAEAKKLAKSFTSNQGKLPWPTLRGKVTKRFGKQRHPALPGIYTNSSGIEITTVKNSKVRAVFNGTVAAVLKVKGGLQGVIIKHGNYFTVYYQLKKVFVKKGDKVTTKQNIGVVGTNLEGKNILKFKITKNSTKLNPVKWIYKMR